MNKLFQKMIVALLAIVWGVTTMQAQNVNMERYITLTVKEGANIELDLFAEEANTPIKIVSGNKEQSVTVGKNWTGTRKYPAGAGTMTIYGNILNLDCSENGTNITKLEASHNTKLNLLNCYRNSISLLDLNGNTQLTKLNCFNNSLTSLDLSHNTQLESLNCSNNSITSLNVEKNAQLTILNCNNNPLTSLNISGNTKLNTLYCCENSLSTLDVSKNTELGSLFCFKNAISSLDVSKNTELEELHCYDNPISSIDLSHNSKLKRLICFGSNLTTAALDDTYCSLPDRTGKGVGEIATLLDASSFEKDKVLATNGNNATAKNWRVLYYKENTDITGFTGTHSCTSGIEEAENTPAFTVYPNPVKDVLNITTDQPIHSIHIYNAYGTEVAHAADTNSINVSHLPAGVYMVRADGKVTRIIKE